VTYRGLPLYRFTGDTKPGETTGEGIRDVGVWHAAGGKR
jgi:predicted lipoprotein with Yx(FWY)xxD motif